MLQPGSHSPPPPLSALPKENTGFIIRLEQAKRKNFTLLGRLKNEGQKFFKYFRMSISKFENLKQLLPTDKRMIHDGDVA
jgi:hypothetical protein